MPIVDGDGRWVIYQSLAHHSWQHDAALLTAEQAHAKPFLKRFDLVADGRLGNEEFVRRAGKAQVSRGRFKDPQSV